MVNCLHAAVNSRLLLRRYEFTERMGEASLRLVLGSFIRNCKGLRIANRIASKKTFKKA